MITLELITPQEMQQKIADKLRAKRLALNLSQRTLSAKSGVSYSVLKKFESTGHISLQSLLQLAFNLGSLDGFNALFPPEKLENLTLEDLIHENTRKRGRK